MDHEHRGDDKPIRSSNAISQSGDTNGDANAQRRNFVRASTGLLGGAALMAIVPPGVRSAAWAAGSMRRKRRR